MASTDARESTAYPLSIRLTGRRCLVVGGGRVGTRKVLGLVDAHAVVTVVGPRPTAVLERLATDGRIELRRHEYRPSDLTGCTLAFAATNDAALNRLVADDAAAAGILVNVADDPGRSTFTVPAVLRRGPLSVAVSSGAAAPVVARRLRDEIDPFVGPAWGRLARLFAGGRDELRAAFPDPADRAAALDRALRDTLVDRAALDDAIADGDPVGLVGEHAPRGHVALVGAGPGDPDLLTIRGARLIRRADVIVHDRLGTEEILPLAADGCELVDVGKAPGRHGMSQAEISELLVELGRAGRRVVRLKGGDPFVFGRGGEEVLALAAAGIEFEIVPGVTAAIGGATAAGLPLTHRAVSQSVTIASGHDDPASPAAAARWAALGAAPGTLVLMMAMGNLAAIAAALIGAGRSRDEPACAIQWATTPRERRIEATLATLADACAADGVGNPAVVVIGPVVEVGRRIAAGLETATASAPPRR